MFTAKPTLYSSSESRVQYAASWFGGAAARYFQTLVERESEVSGQYNPALHEWDAFVQVFGRLFGLYDEKLQAQSNLSNAIQKTDEPFADFIVRFEDQALRTGYNEEALRWHLVDQIWYDLRNRLTLVGRIPDTFNAVVDRLLEIDGAREVLRNTGTYYNNSSNNNFKGNRFGNFQKNNSTSPNFTNNPSTNTTGPQKKFGALAKETVGKVAVVEESTQVTPNQITKEERDYRMANRLCIRCGKKGHFGRNCPEHKNATEVMRAACAECQCCDDCLLEEEFTGVTPETQAEGGPASENSESADCTARAAFTVEERDNLDTQLLYQIDEGGDSWNLVGNQHTGSGKD